LVVRFWCSWLCEVLVEPRVPRVCGRFCLTAVAQWTAPRTLRRPTSHARHPARGLQALLQRGPQIFASGPRNFFRAPKKFLQRTPQKIVRQAGLLVNPITKCAPFAQNRVSRKATNCPLKNCPGPNIFCPGGQFRSPEAPRNFCRGAGNRLQRPSGTAASVAQKCACQCPWACAPGNGTHPPGARQVGSQIGKRDCTRTAPPSRRGQRACLVFDSNFTKQPPRQRGPKIEFLSSFCTFLNKYARNRPETLPKDCPTTPGTTHRGAMNHGTV
jgi:hypothetical protein